MRLTWQTAASLPLQLLVGVTTVVSADLQPARDVHLDTASAQATFIVPCSNCGTSSGGLPTNESFLFNLQAYPSESPCGTSNLTLNGIPLSGWWESAGIHGQGQASVTASGHDLNLRWFLDCLLNDTLQNNPIVATSRDDAQVLTLTIDEVDGRDIPSLAGFTLSFKQLSTPPELLRLSVRPEYTAIDPGFSSDWRDPPPSLRLTPEDASETPSKDGHPLKTKVDDLRRLEAEVELLQSLIEAKKEDIKASVKGELGNLRSEIDQCDGFVCIIRAVLDKAHGAAKILYWKFRPNPYRDQILKEQSNYWKSAAGGQYPTTMTVSSLPEEEDASRTSSHAKPLNTRDPDPPAQAHCNDGRPGEQPPQWNEKSGFHNHTHTEPFHSEFRDATEPSRVALFFHAIFVLLGLAALYGVIKRRCCSLRQKADRAARREQLLTERAYRRSARQQAIRDWWYGHHRGRPGRRPGDLDEKRQLISEQEGVLEEAMQDEIRQLQIQEQIRNLRRTHHTVDELVRAEEGRATSYRYATPYRQHEDGGPMTQLYGYTPFGITIPPPSSSSYPTSDSPPTPLSRTSSLPGYRSEDEISHPPSYHTDDETAQDTSSDYTPSSATGAWTPASSIPDISPRPSIETTRTFL